MPFVRNSKKSNPTANRKKQNNNMQLKRDTENLEFKMEADDEIVQIADSDSDNELEKSKNVSTKREINELKEMCTLDTGHIKTEKEINIQTIDDDSIISAKKIKLENNSDFKQEQEFTNIVAKVEETNRTEFTTSLQECVKNGDVDDSVSEIEIEISSDSGDTTLQDIKNEFEKLNNVQQIKVEKDCEISKEKILSTLPKTDNISVGELKIEESTTSASEDEYSDNEVPLAADSYNDFSGDVKIEISDEDDMPSTSRRIKEKTKVTKEKIPVKVKEETNNESDSEPEDSQIPSDVDEEFLSTGSGDQEFLTDSGEENSDSENLNLENKDLVTQLIDEYHKRPQLWFEDLSLELSEVKENQLYRSIKDNLNKKFDKKYNLKSIKMLLKLLLEKYKKEIARQLQSNEETVAESSTIWFYDKLNFLKDDIESKVKLKLESSIKLLEGNILAELIDIYKNYDSLWDTNNSSFPDLKKRHETLQSMCLEIKQKLNISFNTFKLDHQLFNLHKKVKEEKEARFCCEKYKKKYKPSFGLITKCYFLESHQEPFKCEECVKEFKTISLFRQHKALHDGTPPYKCHICGVVYSLIKSLQLHSFRHTGVNYYCRICGKQCINPYNLKIHIKNIHMNPKLFNCDVCDESFVHPEEIESHKKQMHDANDVACKCEICDKEFENHTLLNIHKLKYRYTHDCSMCEAKFHQPSVFKTHMNHAHFQCRICKKFCTDQKNLNQHMALHQGKTINCIICGKGIDTLRKLKAHLKYSHGQKQMQCKICGEFCSKHIISDIEEKYDCNICGESFSNPSQLCKHKRGCEEKKYADL